MLTGCGHRGIINTCYHAREITGKNVYAVIGGIHLIDFDADSYRVKKTMEEFKEMGIQRLYLGHCTGFSTLASISQEFGKKFQKINSGIILDF